MEVIRIDVLWRYFQVKGNKIYCTLGIEFDIIYVVINFFLLTSSCKMYFEHLNIQID